MYNTYFTKLINKMDDLMETYRQRDLKRNCVNCGMAQAYATVMHDMGHDVSLRIYEKDGFYITDQITIDGKSYDYFH